MAKLQSVRALEELERQYKTLVENLYDDERRDARCEISEARESADKNAVVKVVDAISKLGLPYKLQHKTLCNIRSNYNDHPLTFVLEFDPKSGKALSHAQKIIDTAELVRNKRLKRLERWKTGSLYNIANGREIEVFEVEPET